MSKHHNIIEIEAFIKHETNDAILIYSDVAEADVWIPKSVADYDGNVLEYNTISLPESFALDKGLI